MKIKMATGINPGEMITMKQEDYKAPCPTGDYLGFCVNEESHFPMGVVLDERIPEGEVHLITCGVGMAEVDQ